MDVGNIAQNILLVTFLGIIVSFNPTLIVVDFLLVLKSKRPIFNTIVLLAGFATAIIILASFAWLLIDPDSQLSFNRLREELNMPPVVDITAGLLILIFGLNKYRESVTNKTKRKPKDIQIPQKPKQIFMFALIKTPLSLTNLFAILLLAKQAASGKWEPVAAFLALIWLLLLGVLPILYMMYLHWFKKASLDVIDKKLNKLLAKDTSLIIGLSCVALGAFFVVKGITDLS